MAAQSLQELFVEELRDMYDAEKRLTKALPKLARAATSEELQAAFTNHARETERQVVRLEQVAETLGHTKAKDLLGATLDEEKAADEKLTSISAQVNREAMMGDEDES